MVDQNRQADDLLVAGRTCWRLERASKVGLLIDNASYFGALRSALLQARQSIIILGWEFDPRTRLHPADDGSTIGRLLKDLADQRPELNVRVLIWNASLGLALGERMMPQRGALWFRNSRVDYQLDSTVPFGATHHQKLVVIDDSIAFCAGDHLIVNRWDRPKHLDEEPGRRTPGGSKYPPRHGMAMAVAGPAARALGDLARDRRHHSIGEQVPPAGGEPAIWPDDVRPDLADVDVAISRTIPTSRGRAEVRENEALYVDAIRSAQRLLYFENQYFTSRVVEQEIARRLAEPDGPEVVVVTGEHAPSFFDRAAMDPPKNALVQRLRSKDPYGRFRLYAPHAPGGRPVLVHSKLMIVDNRLLRIGSSNLADRSFGYDAECDLSIQLVREADREVVSFFLHRLLAHFLGRQPQEVQQSMASSGGLIASIAALDWAKQPRLKSLEGSPPRLLNTLVARFHVGDPLSSSEAWRPWRRNEWKS